MKGIRVIVRVEALEDCGVLHQTGVEIKGAEINVGGCIEELRAMVAKWAWLRYPGFEVVIRNE